MKSPINSSWLIALPALILNTSEIYPNRAHTIQGTICNGNNGKMVENAYIYIISGEEEALTNRKGVFSLNTWQELPVTLIIEHPMFKKKKIRIEDASQHQFIRLAPRQ